MPLGGELVESLAAALAFGLYAGLAPGPTLALVIGQTLRHGRREGFKVACAPLVTDAPIVALALVVLARLAEHGRVLGGISLAGAAFLVVVAVECLRAPPPRVTDAGVAPRSLLKGALANALNPHPYLAWMTVVGPRLLATAEAGLGWAALFLVLFYGVMVGSKMLVAVLVERGRGALRGRGYRALIAALGLVLLGFAIRFAVDGATMLHG